MLVREMVSLFDDSFQEGENIVDSGRFVLRKKRLCFTLYIVSSASRAHDNENYTR